MNALLSMTQGTRMVERWTDQCTHWIGRQLTSTGTQYYAFQDEEAASAWLDSGQFLGEVRPLSFMDAARGCECHARYRVVVARGRGVHPAV
ncbi:MAG TPA: hypothetical protein VGO93_14970 [Candidatus Xenobia bacterium]|jgi:hypothetical protein